MRKTLILKLDAIQMNFPEYSSYFAFVLSRLAIDASHFVVKRYSVTAEQINEKTAMVFEIEVYDYPLFANYIANMKASFEQQFNKAIISID